MSFHRMAFLVDRGESSSSSLSSSPSSSSSSPIIVKHFPSLPMKHYANNTLIASQVLEDLIGEGKKKREKQRQTDRQTRFAEIRIPPSNRIYIFCFFSVLRERDERRRTTATQRQRTHVHARTHALARTHARLID